MEKDQYYLDYEDYVKGVVPLMIFYAFHLAKRENDAVPLEKSLDRCVGIYRKTVYYDKNDHLGKNSADWQNLKGQLIGLFRKHENDSDTSVLEDEAMKILWPLIEPKLYDDSRPLRKGPERPYGCWSYEINKDNKLTLHIDNVFRPESPFDHLEEFKKDLLQLNLDIKEKNPDITIVWTGTWLISFPPFQDIFPDSWKKNVFQQMEHTPGTGTWGQYTNRSGAFHHKNAEKLRQLKKHPYPIKSSFCEIKELIEYLSLSG